MVPTVVFFQRRYVVPSAYIIGRHSRRHDTTGSLPAVRGRETNIPEVGSCHGELVPDESGVEWKGMANIFPL